MSPPVHYLTRAVLRRDLPSDVIGDLIRADGVGSPAAGHRLVWTLFGDHPERTRDFLFREAEGGAFYLLSSRPPEDRRSLFQLDPPRPFAPELRVGDQLHFTLRVNATVAISPGPGRRGVRHDVVMHAIHLVPKEDRGAARAAALTAAATAWMARQGARCGFSLPASNGDEWEAEASSVRVMGNDVVQTYRGRGVAAARFGVLDLEGTLIVDDPTVFLAALLAGFGREKAFGCGLMLVRRARG